MSNSNRFFLNTLFFLQVLLVFLLIFESKIQLPLWLEVAGRLHPALVHLPIGFISVYLILYLFRTQFKKKAYAKISFFVLMLTSLSAVMAAIAGLFLSHQGDYESLSIHKWAAVIFNFICYATVILTQANILKDALAVVAFVVLAAQVIVVGHSGGELTHGKGYVLEPLYKNEKNDDLYNASAYQIAVKPILEKKCFSCHNETKAKGKLIMTSAERFTKGGKNGLAFIPGNAKDSRMIQHIFLPLKHDDHMPPDGKAQLTPVEKRILVAWIQSGASFDKLLTDFTATDSFRILAPDAQVVTKEEVSYSFEAASPSVIEKLSTPFRVIFPLYKNSPALRADFFIAEKYTPEALQDLSSINTQLVELNLSKMPVTDKEISIITGFSNLEILNLNFTKISGNTLSELSRLKNLKTLSVAGTSISFEQIQKLSILSLKEFYIWNTPLSPQQIVTLQSKWKSVKFFSTDYSDDKILRLNSPSIAQTGVLKKNAKLELKHPMKGVVIRFTTDGTLPDSVTGKTYDKPFSAEQTFRLKAIACKSGWYCSPMVESICFVEGTRPSSTQLLTSADKTYSGDGAATLTDGKLGLADQYKEPVWLGYRGAPLSALFQFEKPQPIKTISISYAKNLGAYLFPPAKIEVWVGDTKASLRLIKTLSPKLPSSYVDGTKKDVELITVDEKEYAYYKLVLTPVASLPSWHSGKGEKGWLFVDEVFFN